MRDALALTPASEFCAEEGSAESAPETRLQNVELKDWRKSKRGRGEMQGRHYVYVLTDVGGKRHSYVGYTPRLEDRLAKHNAGSGANSTRGDTWRVFAVFEGFPGREAALRFESLMHLHNVDDVSQWLGIADGIIGGYEEFKGIRLVDE